MRFAGYYSFYTLKYLQISLLVLLCYFLRYKSLILLEVLNPRQVHFFFPLCDKICYLKLKCSQDFNNFYNFQHNLAVVVEYLFRNKKFSKTVFSFFLQGYYLVTFFFSFNILILSINIPRLSKTKLKFIYAFYLIKTFI